MSHFKYFLPQRSTEKDTENHRAPEAASVALCIELCENSVNLSVEPVFR